MDNEPASPYPPPSKKKKQVRQIGTQKFSDFYTSTSSNIYNDPTLPGFDPTRPRTYAQTANYTETYEPDEGPTYYSDSTPNTYNDPTLLGYDPTRPSASAHGYKQRKQRRLSSKYNKSYNKYNDPTLPGYDPTLED